MITIKNFKNLSNGFNYVYEDELTVEEIVLLKMPVVSANKRGINDIGFMADNNIKIYATIASSPNLGDDDSWQEINNYDEINKTTSYLKIVNTSVDMSGKVIVRAILN